MSALPILSSHTMPTGYKCTHSSLVVDVCSNADETGFQRLDWKRRLAATTPSGRIAKNGQEEESDTFASTFPGPLVLPEDDLAYDPSQPPQSLRSWSNLKGRNRVTYDRKTIYVAGPPLISEGVSAMSEWITPKFAKIWEKEGGKQKGKGKKEVARDDVQTSSLDDTLEYLRAFYHGFEVKTLTPALVFEPWSEDEENASYPSFVALKEGPADSYTRIRLRPSPDGLFAQQLNLNDLLDGAIRTLPRDAYALLMLVDHDLYEDEDDDFCCGRAYGGSRVAVVSSARYHRLLHEFEGVDLQHMWPASHCAAYVASQRGSSEISVSSRLNQDSSSPIHQAVTAFHSAPEPVESQDLWLFCLARTAAHELGHCFGLDHCVYYACVMQGTASVAEDYRQPPYLCPVCARKLARAAGEGSSDPGRVERTHTREACEAMARFCARRETSGVWAGYKAWLETGLRGETA